MTEGEFLNVGLILVENAFISRILVCLLVIKQDKGLSTVLSLGFFCENSLLSVVVFHTCSLPN